MTMTEKQKNQFNRMLAALRKIHKGYQTPEQLRRNCKGHYGLDYQESLEMAYENLQAEARFAAKGIKEINRFPPQQVKQ
jgi:hypothetical protein